MDRACSCAPLGAGDRADRRSCRNGGRPPLPRISFVRHCPRTAPFGWPRPPGAVLSVTCYRAPTPRSPPVAGRRLVDRWPRLSGEPPVVYPAVDDVLGWLVMMSRVLGDFRLPLFRLAPAGWSGSPVGGVRGEQPGVSGVELSGWAGRRCPSRCVPCGPVRRRRPRRFRCRFRGGPAPWGRPAWRRRRPLR